MKRMIVLSVAGVSALIGSALLAPSVAMADAPTTLANGFTAAVVAHTGQKISGTIDASGYDVGVYIGPGVHGVTVSGATIKGANDEGILVQDTSGVVIRDSVLTGNAVSNDYNLGERKAIVLIGSSGVLVTGNTVTYNGDGGIGVYDDGPNSPSAPVALDATPVNSNGNVISGNTITNNFGGCGIVVSAKEDGGAVNATTVSHNTVTSSVPGAVGGLIIASGSVGAGTVSNTVVSDNAVTGGYIAGIGMHSSGQGVLTGTQILGNTFTSNGGQEVVNGAPVGTGVEILTSGTVTKTQVLHNTVVDDYYGVFHVGDSGTHVAQLSLSGVTAPIAG